MAVKMYLSHNLRQLGLLLGSKALRSLSYRASLWLCNRSVGVPRRLLGTKGTLRAGLHCSDLPAHVLLNNGGQAGDRYHRASDLRRLRRSIRWLCALQCASIICRSLGSWRGSHRLAALVVASICRCCLPWPMSDVISAPSDLYLGCNVPNTCLAAFASAVGGDRTCCCAAAP